MPKLFDSIIKKIEAIKSFEDFEKNKLSLIADIERLKQNNKLKEFQIKKYLKDKNIINSLLVKTSDNLQKVLDELRIRVDEINTLLDTIPAFVFFKDREYKYVLVNKSFIDFINLPEEKIIGKTVQELSFKHKLLNSYSKYEKKVLEEGIPQYNISEKLEKNDKYLWLNTNLAPVKNSNNEIIGFIGISWDITNTKEYEKKLKKAKILAEEGTKAKSQFMANMSHEIRTPLNGIIGMTQILEGTRLTKKQMEFVDIIATSGDNLLMLINDILDFSKIEAGKINFINENFLLKKPFKEVRDILSLRAKGKGIMINCNIDNNVPGYVTGDEYRLKQIILNLANNAIKFTEKGFININIEYLGKDKDKHKIKVSVEDTGIGINKEDIKGLFKSFSQLDASSTKQYGGTGLGLAISKRLVEMMEGEIGVTSKKDVGSTFWFTAKFNGGVPPVKKEETKVNGQKRELKTNKSVILVVEDNIINQKITAFSLTKAGMKVTIANNGKEAVKLFHKQHFDVVLMDIQMPVMDGFDATIAIRNIEKSQQNNSHTPIIALTANAMQGDAERCLKAGMDDYISKPFKIENLIKVLDKMIK